MKIVLLPPAGKEFSDRVKEVAPEADIVVHPDEETAVSAVADAEVILGAVPPREVFQAAKRLRWFQTVSAGMDRLFKIPELREGDFALTNGSGPRDPGGRTGVGVHLGAFQADPSIFS